MNIEKLGIRHCEFEATVNKDGRNEYVKKEGFFLCWGTSFEEIGDTVVEITVGVVEDTEGNILCAVPERIKFTTPIASVL